MRFAFGAGFSARTVTRAVKKSTANVRAAVPVGNALPTTK